MLLFYPILLVCLFVCPAMLLEVCHAYSFHNTSSLSVSYVSPYFTSTLSYCCLFIYLPILCRGHRKAQYNHECPWVCKPDALLFSCKQKDLVSVSVVNLSVMPWSMDPWVSGERSWPSASAQANSWSGLPSRNFHSVICMPLFLSCGSNGSSSLKYCLKLVSRLLNSGKILLGCNYISFHLFIYFSWGTTLSLRKFRLESFRNRELILKSLRAVWCRDEMLEMEADIYIHKIMRCVPY